MLSNGFSDKIGIKPGAEWRPEPVSAPRNKSPYSHCELDVLAYYKPYTSSKDGWGIYFVEPNIDRDQNQLINELTNMINSGQINEKDAAIAILSYPVLILLHELCHHVLEDVRIKMGHKNPYDSNDEKLCEYTAYTLIEKAHMYLLTLPLLHMIRIVKDAPFQVFSRFMYGAELLFSGTSTQIDLQLFTENEAIVFPVSPTPVKRGLSILYYWFGRDSNSMYRPIVPNYPQQLLDAYADALLRNLVVGLDHLAMSSPVDESVWARIGVDKNERRC